MSIKSIEINENYVASATAFIETEMKNAEFSDDVIKENLLVLEELMLFILSQNSEISAPKYYLQFDNKSGNATIKLEYYGKRLPSLEDVNETINYSILDAYRDKYEVNYIRGLNTITMTIKKSNIKRVINYLIVIVLGLITGVIISKCCSADIQSKVISICNTAEVVFEDVLLLISTPLAFFSLLSNITTVAQLVDRRINLKRIINVVIYSSFVAILIAVISFQLRKSNNIIAGIYIGGSSQSVSWVDFITALTSDIPQTLGEALTSSTPLPFIILAVLTAQAICISGKYFYTAKNIVDTINTVLCKMLSIVMKLMPVMLFIILVHEVYMLSLKKTVLVFFLTFAIAIVHIIILIFIYCIRIWIRRGKPIWFIRQCLPAVNYNLATNSAPDAVPYNSRFLHRLLRLPIGKLYSEMSILAEISQVGNCICLASIFLAAMNSKGVSYDVSGIIVIAVMIFLLSIGAPAQPGSMLVGALVLCSFENISIHDIGYFFIECEVMLGWVATVINIAQDFGTQYYNYIVDLKNNACKK